MGKRLLLSVCIAMFVTACGGGGGGDIKIQPTTIDNSVNDSNNSGGGGGDTTGLTDDDCASYVNAGGSTVQGNAVGTNCEYSAAFVDSGNNLEFDLFIPALPDGGAHIFDGSLFVGVNYDNDADLAAARITEGGDGPELTIEAGATLAFRTNADFVIINRGSQIFASGTAEKPITFTSVGDVNGDITDPEATQLWGGMVINGFATTNKCSYTGNRGEAGFSTSDCHVAAEGAAGLDTSHYGGDNDADSSGVMQFVRVKHTGAEVASGDELNGISFGGVGSTTVVKNLQVYSTNDDGIEMFGGSFDIENYVAVYVRDDSIDIDEGYNGTITNALVIQSDSIGNRCIESDGLGSFSSLTDADKASKIAQGLQSAPTISNLTCIVSPSPLQGNFDPGQGFKFREGIYPTISDSLVISSFGEESADDNACSSISDGSFTTVTAQSNILACVDQDDPIGNSQYATLTDVTDATANADTQLILLEGTPSVYSVAFSSMVVDDAAPTVTAPVSGHVGGVTLADDWLRPNGVDWTYGIFDGSRGQPLWFE